jgi:hypothetical protein
MPEPKPKIWSDFDGTAVTTTYRLDPRNWLKYPLHGMDGYADFLDGARLTEGEENLVEIAGVVTRRPDILVRRFVTARSVDMLELRKYFPNNSQLVHTGSEQKKAQFIFDQSAEAPIGMLEDRPHKLGNKLLEIFASQQNIDDAPERRILIGVVDHEKSQAHIAELIQTARQIAGSDAVEEFEYKANKELANTGYQIKIGDATLKVVQLAPYSRSSGEHFACELVACSDS